MAKIPSVDDWRNAVMKHRAIQGEVRALLLYVSIRMGIDRKFSIPQGELAKRFDVSTRRIRGRIEQAREVGLLVTVLQGKPGTTAVYQGTFPDSSCAARPAQRPTKYVPEGRHKQTPEHVPHVVPPSSKHVEPEPFGSESLRGTEEVARPTLRVGPHINDEESTAASESGLTRSVRHENTSVDGVVRETPKGHPSPESPPFARSEATPAGSRETGGSRETRQRILDEIQLCAATDTCVSEYLAGLLNDYDDGGLGDWAINYWTIKKEAAASRYEAGRQLTMLINTYRSAA